MTIFKTISATLILISTAIFATNTEAADFTVFTDKIISWHSLNPEVWISVNQNRKALTGAINQGANSFTDHTAYVSEMNSITFSDTSGNSCVVIYSMSWTLGIRSIDSMYLSPGNNNMSCSLTVGSNCLNCNNLIAINHK